MTRAHETGLTLAGPDPRTPPPNAAPPGFVAHVFEKRFRVSAPRSSVWQWLEDPTTFVDSQVWPYRVEFVSAEAGVAPGFQVGGLNVHHGPFLHLPGMLTEIREGYRDLHYFYGSFVLSPRLVRPTRLEFRVEDAPEGDTGVEMRLTSFVRGGFAGLWTFGQRLFWSRFPRWMARSLGGRVSG